MNSIVRFRGAARYILLSITVATLSCGCSHRPKGIIDEDRMVQVMADIQVAEAYERSGNSDAYLRGKSREELGKGVLASYGITLEEMDSTLAWYGRNMDEYSKLYKKVDAELGKRQLKYARAAGESKDIGASADLWPYGRHFVIDDLSWADGIAMSIPVTDLNPGDRLVWKMNAEGATGKNITFGVEYEDGSTGIVRNTSRSFDRMLETTLQTDTVLGVTRIFGIAKFDHSQPQVFVDSIMLLHLPYSVEEYHNAGYQRRVAPAARKIILPPDSSINSTLVPDSIKEIPSSSTANNLGVSTLR